MVKFTEMSDGYYILEASFSDVIYIKEAFMKADKSLDEISTEPKSNGFKLEVSDPKEN